jgi:hypothetical protein
MRGPCRRPASSWTLLSSILLSSILLAWALLLCPRPAAAEPAGAADEPVVHAVHIDLVTVGPGDALLSRAGHVALMVTETLADGRELTRGYNYGVTDFSDPWIPLRFVFGELRFFSAPTGDLYATAEHYGLLQDRDVWRQRLALTPAQARAVAERLELDVRPEHREYAYHYLEETCSTKVRDLLDVVTDGALRRQLDGQLDAWTVRDFQQLTFDGAPLTALVADVMFGRMHDLPQSRHYTLLWPERMRTALPEVMVPDPAGGGGLVPLAGPPEQLAARGGPPAVEHRNRVTWIVAPLGLLWVLVGAAWVARRARARAPAGPTGRVAGLWLWSWALPTGLAGAAIVVLQLVSTLPQLRGNELVASLLATDLWLVGVGLRWWRRGLERPRGLYAYAVARLVVVSMAVAGRAVGLLIQEPWIVPVASLGCAIALLWVARELESAH